MSAYHRVRSRPFSARLLHFGDACRYNKRSHEALSNVSDGRRLHLGVFVDGQAHRAIHGPWRRYGEVTALHNWASRSETNDKEALSEVCATPWDLHRPRGPEVIFKDRPDKTKDENFDERVSVARQVYFKTEDLEEHGLTRGCPRCNHQLRYGPERTGKLHSQLCRARIMAELAETTAGRLRVSASTHRMDRIVAKLGQQVRHDVPQGENGRVEHRQPEAPPPADELGGSETHDFEGCIPENPGPAGLGMDVDAVDYKPEADLKELFQRRPGRES